MKLLTTTTLLLCAASAGAATLHLAGDSTLDTNGGWPYASWGNELETFMTAPNRVRNLAKSGASTKSFIADGYWAKLIEGVQPGDTVAIEFGHNDQKRSTEAYLRTRWCDPKGAFRDNIRGWVKEIRAKGAEPVLLSPIRRATFDKEGRKLVDAEQDGVCLGSYRTAMAELAAELGCEYVDMNTLTGELMEQLGREAALRFFVISTGIVRGKDGEPAMDTTHPILAGARAFAKLFVADAKRRGLRVAKFFDRGDYAITSFGAVADGRTKCTDAFAKAFAAAEAAGGGRIVVPKGRFLTGAIRFRSNCELHLEEGAEVLFTQDPADYLPAVFTSWEGMECVNYCPLVYAYECENVAVTGPGTLNGYEGRWEHKLWYPWVWQQNGIKASRLQLYTWGAEDHPPLEREIWKRPNANTRPHLMQFNRCRNVRWEDFRVRNSPFWTLHLYLCDNVYVKGLDVSAHANNNDGIDIEMTRNVLVERCRFDQGDDTFVIKSGRNRDGWRLGRPTENVEIRDCHNDFAKSYFCVGSELSGGARNIRIHDCSVKECNRLFYVKTNRRRGGTVSGISMENVSCEKARRVCAVETDVLYEWADFPDHELRNTVIENLSLRNVRADETEYALYLKGCAELPVKGVTIDNLAIGSASRPDEVSGVENLVRR